MPTNPTQINSHNTKISRQLAYISVYTQTENNLNYETMISKYKKSIDILTNKIVDYEKLITKLKKENDMFKLQNELSKEVNSLVKHDLVEEKTMKEKSTCIEVGNKFKKGCSCKGTCVNKICGCVKKGNSCNKNVCKCNSVQCKNQEVGKENVVDQKELLHNSESGLEKLGCLALNQKILHSAENKKNCLLVNCKKMIDVNKNSTSPLPLGTRSRLFIQADSEDTVDILSSNSYFSNREGSDKTDNLYSHKSTVKCDSKSNDEIEQLNFVVTMDEVQNKMQSLYETRVNTDINFLPKIAKVIHSPVDKKELKFVLNDDYIAQRKYNSNAIVGMISALSDEEINEKKHTNNKPNPERVPHSEKPLDEYPVLENNIENPLEVVSNFTDSNNYNSNLNVLDVSSNPMVPKRQLPRSPISAAGNIIFQSESKRFSPPKKGLAVAEVDWVQHKSELVMCKNCKRKFFPHRIDKHIISCKGI